MPCGFHLPRQGWGFQGGGSDQHGHKKNHRSAGSLGPDSWGIPKPTSTEWVLTHRHLGYTIYIYIYIYVCVCTYIYIRNPQIDRKVGNLHRTAILEVLLGICLWATMTGFLVLNHFLRCASKYDCAHQPQFLGMELLPDMTRLRCSYGIDILRTVGTVMICSYQ